MLLIVYARTWRVFSNIWFDSTTINQILSVSDSTGLPFEKKPIVFHCDFGFCVWFWVVVVVVFQHQSFLLLLSMLLFRFQFNVHHDSFASIMSYQIVLDELLGYFWHIPIHWRSVWKLYALFLIITGLCMGIGIFWCCAHKWTDFH